MEQLTLATCVLLTTETATAPPITARASARVGASPFEGALEAGTGVGFKRNGLRPYSGTPSGGCAG